MLGATLILCLVVSFFGIDVWMISLPFALGKLLFDLGRDYYRYWRGMEPFGHELPQDQAEELSEGSPVEEQQVMGDSDLEQSQSLPTDETAVGSGSHMPNADSKTVPQVPEENVKLPYVFRWYRSYLDGLHQRLEKRFPTFMTALPRLPFALVPFAFSQFILIEALNHQGWVQVFAGWLVRASGSQVQPTIWLIGVLGVILCNLSGTNIGATILLTKVVRAAAFPYETNRAAAIALAVASNVGAVSFTFAASLAGLLWKTILGQKDIHVKQRDFAFWNLLPILVMTTVGLGIVSAEMAVLFHK